MAKSNFSKLILLICLLSTFSLNAQMRTRTNVDSAKAVINHFWYWTGNYQFQQAFPKPQIIPPLSSGMDYETLIAYIIADSLMHTNFSNDTNNLHIVDNWKRSRQKNDTIIAFTKFLYEMVDFDPIRFYQYMYNQSKGYYHDLNLNSWQGMVVNVLLGNPLQAGIISDVSPNKPSMCGLLFSDYILRVHVNSISYLPLLGNPGKMIYDVNATVLDTLKGKVFQNCNLQTLIKKNTKDKPLTNEPTICFDYPYVSHIKETDNSLLDTDGAYALQPGQDLIVGLSFSNYKWDFNNDYLNLDLLWVMPVINEQVKDNWKVWSNSTSPNYSDWKISFFQKKDMLLNGAY